jgi:hypothetical protein
MFRALEWAMPSTAIGSYRYDPDRRKLQVRFLSAPDTAYVYLDVPPAYYLGLELARSKGAYVNREIKPRFRCLRLAAVG